MKKIEYQISASEFKKHFLSLVNQVNDKHNSYIITKRKKPIAKIVPLEQSSDNQKSYYGRLRGSIKINADIINENFASDWEEANE